MKKYDYDNKRLNSHARGYDKRWARARKQFLMENPLCKICELRGDAVPATVVDHRIPHKGDKEIFWDEENWQALCKPCHDRKTFSDEKMPTLYDVKGYKIAY